MERLCGGIAVRRRGLAVNGIGLVLQGEGVAVKRYAAAEQYQAMALQDTASQGEGIVRKRNREAWRREAVE